MAPLIRGLEFGALLGDRAFEGDWLRAGLDARGTMAVIPLQASRQALLPCDQAMYRWRHLIENDFATLREFRAVAARHDKTDNGFRATINLAAAIIASR